MTPRQIWHTKPAVTAPPPPPAPAPAPKAAPKPAPTPQASAAKKPAPAPAAPRLDQFKVVEYRQLALRYTLLKYEDGQHYEVTPKMVFRSGDRVRVRLAANQDGHLYVLSKGTSGNWATLATAQLAEEKETTVPADLAGQPRTFTFDDQAGEELLVVVFSRQPRDIEALIRDMQARPAGRDRQTLAQAVPGDQMKRFRSMQSRDLIIENVESAQAKRPVSRPVLNGEENATYVASKSMAPDALLVAEVALIHQ
jgi:hypothetical protein